MNVLAVENIEIKFSSDLCQCFCVCVANFYLLPSFAICFHFLISLYECQDSYFLTSYYWMSWILLDQLFGWTRKLRGAGGIKAQYLHGLWNQRTVTLSDAIQTDSFTQILLLHFSKPNHIKEGFCFSMFTPIVMSLVETKRMMFLYLRKKLLTFRKSNFLSYSKFWHHWEFSTFHIFTLPSVWLASARSQAA